jgi:hypothetical protein
MSWESKFAQILADHLSTAAAITAGLPAVNDCPRRIFTSLEDAVRPVIIVSAVIPEDKHPHLILLDLTFTLKTNSPDGDGNDGTPVSTAELWLQALRGHLTDRASLKTQLATLSEADRTGWRLVKLRLNATTTTEIDPDSRARDYAQNLRLWIEISAH